MSDPRDTLCRVPPHAEHAEKAILGAVLQEDKCLPFVRSVIGPDDLYVEAHRAIFVAMIELADAGTRIDSVTLSARLTARGQLDRVGGPAYMDQCIDAIPVASHVEDQAAIVRELALVRLAILGLTQVAATAFDGASAVDLSCALSRLAADVLPASPCESPADLLDGMIEGAPTQSLALPIVGHSALGISVDLGNFIGPIEYGEKLIVGGRPSVGKTAFLTMIWASCAANNIPAHFISLEDPARAIVARAAGSLSWLVWGAILARKWSEPAKVEARKIRDWLKTRPVTVERLRAPTPDELAIAVRRAVTQGSGPRGEGAHVVFVDYIQCIADRGKESRNREIAQAMSGLTRAAGEDALLGIGSQLNREGVKAGEKPTLANLRDSGVLEQEARCVILLSRAGDDVRDDKGKPVTREVTMDVAKNKSDAEGVFTGTFHLRHSALWPGVERPRFMDPPIPENLQQDIPVDDPWTSG